ncbi:MAG: DUF3619 family protein [Comamonas sp.]
MNRNQPTFSQTVSADAFARRLAARLTEGESELGYDISERLRAAREQALARRKVVAEPAIARHPAPETASAISGVRKWWRAAVSAVPLGALMAGLVFFNGVQADEGASEMAAFDATLLADELPPSAYTDPGFAQYLKNAMVAQPAAKSVDKH